MLHGFEVVALVQPGSLLAAVLRLTGSTRSLLAASTPERLSQDRCALQTSHDAEVMTLA